MNLEGGQTLRARPSAGRIVLQPPLQPRGIAMTPPKMLVERKEDTRPRRFIAVWKPELMIALIIRDNGVQAITYQFAVNR